MTENEFLLADRIQKIQSMNQLYDLEHNAYISYSGGKDSTVLSHLIDEALPNNKIPRVYLNTGIEYLMIVSFVERERETVASRLFDQRRTSRRCYKRMAIRSRARNTLKKCHITNTAEWEKQF